MKLKFSINYTTRWGESLHVIITYHGRDGRERTQDLTMSTADGMLWTLETAAILDRRHNIESFDYRYVVEDQFDKILREEWKGEGRQYDFDSNREYVFLDQWLDLPMQFHLFSSAYKITEKAAGKMFAAERAPQENSPENLSVSNENDSGTEDETRSLLKSNRERRQLTSSSRSEHNYPLSIIHYPLKPRLLYYRKTILFRVSAPQLLPGQSVALTGSHPALGAWSDARYLRMQQQGEYDWILSVNADVMQLPIEYKFVVVDDNTHQLVAWEEGDNRRLDLQGIADGQCIVVYGEQLRVKEKTWKLAGVAVPLFSLRTEKSAGAGDFGDLMAMADWMSKAGLRVLQLLPLNDTGSSNGWTDSHPYNAISVFALHPHYMDLEQLGELRDQETMRNFQRQRRELNQLEYSDYMAVDRVKGAYIQQAFEETGANTLESDDFKLFFEENKDWLPDYAAFCVMRDKYATADFSEWKEMSKYNEQEVTRICSPGSIYINKVRLVYFTQYHLHRQLQKAADYVRSKGIILKADLQISVNRHSVETWRRPWLFNLDMQAGSPPDDRGGAGANWEFPTYNWEAMRGDGYQWWHRRFEILERYFDAIRIDHILAYFRIWEIPGDAVQACLGHFSPAAPLNESDMAYYGLSFRHDLYTQPFINDYVVQKIFGIHANFVKDNFLERKAYGLYSLKPDYTTQKGVLKAFKGRYDENSVWIREGLLKLVANVLFTEDPRQPGHYHPRIGAWKETVFDILSEEEKDAYMRLYDNYFYRRHDAMWESTALERLPAILKDTRMLVCAESLGMMPQCVEPVLDRLRILTLQVQTMPNQGTSEFAHIGSYPYRSIATPTTHDMPSIRLWWEENRERTQRYYTDMLQKQGKAPLHLTPALAEEIVARHYYSPSMLCIIAIQDLLAIDNQLRDKNIYAERINTPADPFNRWQYRMPVSIEALMDATQYNRKLTQMAVRSRRGAESELSAIDN